MRTIAGNPARTPGPVPHLSAGRHLIAQRYVIGWPNGVVKVGNTNHGRRRWGRFIAHGGTMIDLAYYGNLMHGLEGEIWLQARIAKEYRRAYRDKAESFDNLGPGGSGWMECYAVPVSDWAYIAELARAE